jgi:hypothetical protein
MVLLFYAAALPVILFGTGKLSRGAADQNDWHLPVIRQFIAQWPHLDLSDYPSSTTPGYHIVLAGLGHATHAGPIGLRLFGSLFTAALLGILGFYVGQRLRAMAALAVCLPVLCSIYIFSSGVFLLPDNAGWLGVLCIMLVALRPTVDRWTYILGGALLLATVLFRQIDAWPVAPLLAAAFIGNTEDTTPQVSPVPAGATASAVDKKSASRAFIMLLAICPALLALYWFHHLWHGSLVPPNQRVLTSAFAPAAPAIILAIAGVVAVFYCGFLLPHAGSFRAIAWGMAVGALLGILPHTTYDIAARRYSGLWNAARHFPYAVHRSPLIVLMATFGGGAVAAWLAALPLRNRLIWGSAAIAFALAQSASANPWQRYYEPFILIAAALCTADLAGESGSAVVSRWTLIGPLVLAAFCAVVTAAGLR